MTEDNVTMPGGTDGATLFGSTPADVKEAARLALSAALRDPRTGFSVKAAMMSGAYDAFSEAVEAAILAERENWKGAAEAAFDEGVAQERQNIASALFNRNGAMTAEVFCGEYFVKIRFPDIKEMHAFHDDLTRLSLARSGQ